MTYTVPMINPIDKARELFQAVEPEDFSVKVLALIPVICNLFLEVKKNQLHAEGKYKKLKEIACIVKNWRVGQLILIPYIAKQLETMTFKGRFCALGALTVFAVIHDAHLDGVMELAEKNL